MGRDVEVMELRVLTLREVQALGEFLAGDAGREFMSLSSGALQHAGHDRRDDEDGPADRAASYKYVALHACSRSRQTFGRQP